MSQGFSLAGLHVFRITLQTTCAHTGQWFGRNPCSGLLLVVRTTPTVFTQSQPIILQPACASQAHSSRRRCDFLALWTKICNSNKCNLSLNYCILTTHTTHRTIRSTNPVVKRILFGEWCLHNAVWDFSLAFYKWSQHGPPPRRHVQYWLSFIGMLLLNKLIVGSCFFLRSCYHIEPICVRNVCIHVYI